MNNTFMIVIDKYYEGAYGIDQSEYTQYCVFHALFAQVILELLK